MTNGERAIVYLDGLINLEYKHKRKIIDLYQDIGEIFTNPEIAVQYLTQNASQSYAKTFLNGFKDKIYEKIITNSTSEDITAVTEISEDYPKSLLCLENRPLCLYCKGNTKLLNSKNIFSIVGSRKTLVEYSKLAKDFSYQLSNAGVTIVTGVADGGDKSAILGAIDSGNLILVLAGGFDFVDSERNRDLINKASESCLVITEYPKNVPQLAFHYPVRNRIIAGLSKGTLICSGSLKSGTKYTADYCLNFGREVFCFPYAINVSSGELCNKLIKDGAYLVDSVDDICLTLGFEVIKQQKISLTNEENAVYLSIKKGNIFIDALLEDCNLKIFELLPILTTLEIKGYIVKGGNSEYNVLK